MRSLLLAIGVCYLARLEEKTRDTYAGYICNGIEELTGQYSRAKGSDVLMKQVQL